MTSNKKLLLSGFQTAVLLIVFNRPNTTIQVFEKIRKAKPQRLYVACDGPREGHEGDNEKISKVREIVAKINWSCEVKTLFRDKNLGLKKAVSSAITWFFKYEEQGIILEDDCLPHIDFFRFCETMLNYYKHEKRVMTVGGNNFQNGIKRGNYSYYFSKYPHCWGWATWRRSWSCYDEGIKFWPKWKVSTSFKNRFYDKLERNYWEKIFNLVHQKKVNSWAYSLIACAMKENALTVTPNSNLVSNIGFGYDSTHTKNLKDKLSKLQTKKLKKKLVFSKKIEIDIKADLYTFNFAYGGKNLRFPRNWLLLPVRIMSFIIRKVKNTMKSK